MTIPKQDRPTWQIDHAKVKTQTVIDLLEHLSALSGLEDLTYEVVEVLGYNADLDIGSEDIIEQGGDYPWPAAATLVKVASSDDTNDKAAATGAKEVTVYGLDANYLEISEAEDPDGNSGNETTLLFLRINKIEVTSAGVLRSNQGIIYVGTGSLSAGVPQTFIHGTIGAGFGKSSLGLYTVPAGKTAYLLAVEASCALDAIIGITILQMPFGTGEKVVDRFQMHQSQQSGLLKEYKGNFPTFTEKTDIRMRGTSDTNEAILASKMVLLVVDN